MTFKRESTKHWNLFLQLRLEDFKILNAMITSVDLEPIASSVPSFQPKWQQMLEAQEPEDADILFVEFSARMCMHLVEAAVAGDFSDFELLFAAIEFPLSDRKTELFDSLTMGFLESLMNTCKMGGVSLARVRECITGNNTRREWDDTYNYKYGEPTQH